MPRRNYPHMHLKKAAPTIEFCIVGDDGPGEYEPSTRSRAGKLVGFDLVDKLPERPGYLEVVHDGVRRRFRRIPKETDS